jgi:hypothetical protein
MPRHSNNTRIVATAVLLGSVLAGCSDIYYDRRETISFAAYDATASAQATQTVDPWPAASANRHIAANGSQVAGAVERYRTCQIIQPRATTTSAAYGNAPLAVQPGCTPAPPAATSSVK